MITLTDAVKLVKEACPFLVLDYSLEDDYEYCIHGAIKESTPEDWDRFRSVCVNKRTGNLTNVDLYQYYMFFEPEKLDVLLNTEVDISNM